MAPAVFHIRGLKAADVSPSALHPTSPAAVQLAHESEYDDLVATEPAAKLSYIDDDDGEIITVGTSVELFSRIEELHAIKPVCFDLLASLRSTGAANNADGIRAWVRHLREQGEPAADEDPAITVVDAKTPEEEEAAAAEAEDWKTPFERELRGLMESQPPQAPADIVKHAMQSMRWATESALSETGPAVQNFQSVIKNALELMQTHVGRAAADGAERARQAADATRGLDLSEVEEGRKAVLKLAEGLSQFAIGAGRVAGGFAEEVGREATAMARRTREDDRAFLHELTQVGRGTSPAPRDPSPAPPLTRVSPRPEQASVYTEPADPAPVHKDSAFWQQMDKIASAKNATVEDAEDEDNEILAQMYDQVFNPPPSSHSPPPAPRAYSPPPAPPAPRWSPLQPAPYSPPPHHTAAPTLHSPPAPQQDSSARPPYSWLFGDDPRRHRHRHPHHHHPRRFHHQHAGPSRHYIRERSASPPSQQPAYEFIHPSSVHRPQVPRPPSVPRPLSNPFDTPPRAASPPMRRSTSPFMRERNSPEMMMRGASPVRVYSPVRVHSPPVMPGGFPEHEEREKWDRCVAQLVDMGYGDGEVVEVARLAGGDVALACEMLEDERAALNAMGL